MHIFSHRAAKWSRIKKWAYVRINGLVPYKHSLNEFNHSEQRYKLVPVVEKTISICLMIVFIKTAKLRLFFFLIKTSVSIFPSNLWKKKKNRRSLITQHVGLA